MTLLAIEQMVATICNQVEAITGIESIPLADCYNRVNAKKIVAPFDFPTSLTSAMDGYAIAIADIESVKLFVIDQYITAGIIPKKHKRGKASRIFTGAVLPEGANCIVIQENAKVDGQQVRFSGNPRLYDNVRPAGSNFAVNDVLCPELSLLTIQRIALLAMAGSACLDILRKPLATVIALGDELSDINKPLPPGKIFDSNSILMTLLLEQFGCKVRHTRLDDDFQVIADFLEKAAQESDIIITSGGASVGDKDFVSEVIKQIGEVQAWKVNIKPGKPILFGKIGTVPFFGLPGNPASALVSMAMFVRPAIYCLHGRTPPPLLSYRLPLIKGYTNTNSRVQYLWCWRLQEGLKITNNQQSASLQASATANGVCKIDGKASLPAGEMVDYYPLDDILAMH